VQVIGVVSEISGMVLEYLPGGDLLTYLKKFKKGGKDAAEKLIEIAEDVKTQGF